MNPLITVILPVYNNNKFLAKCINSILNQTYSNFELIIINDGSSDGSELTCRDFAAKDSRVKLFEQDNLGVSVARNVGLKNAKGDWITFCDSDDWVDDLWLETYVANISPEDEIVVQGFKSIGWPTGKTEIGIKDNFQTKEEFILLMNNIHVLGYNWCKLFKREIIEKHNIYNVATVRVLEDEIFVLRYFTKISNVKNIPYGYYNYVYPDYHNKYKKKRNPEYAFMLSGLTREIFGDNNFSNPLIIRYYHMALGVLLFQYKNYRLRKKDLMIEFLQFFYDYIPNIPFNRPMFKPLKFILLRNNPTLSYYLFVMYCNVLKVLNK